MIVATVKTIPEGSSLNINLTGNICTVRYVMLTFKHITREEKGDVKFILVLEPVLRSPVCLFSVLSCGARVAATHPTSVGKVKTNS